MTDSAYLKAELGPVLARGIAETVAARPWDPVHYLGNWLLHYLEENKEEERRKQRRVKEEQEREEWNKVRTMRRGQAAGVIQREWKAFQITEGSRKNREKDLLLKIQEMEREIDEIEDFKEEAGHQAAGEEQELTEEEREREQERLRALVTYRKAQALLTRSELSAIGDVKRMQRPNPEIVTAMRCAAYLLFNKRPKDVKNWEQIKNIIKPTPFLIAAGALDPGRSGAAPVGGGDEGEEGAAAIPPAAAQAGKKRQYLRVRRILKSLEVEKVKEASVVVFVVLQFLRTAIDYRERRDEERKARQEAGKDVEDDEEEEEEEPADPEERDADEERERAREEEEERKRQEEEAKMREEMEAEEGGEEEEN